mmetsp:Transcript_77333/g.240288  ORF Transcript_77333/g.240288 Transcript_77333/m.240288 type:complete len:210 (+) Transcript_77333:332-961(+)
MLPRLRARLPPRSSRGGGAARLPKPRPSQRPGANLCRRCSPEGVPHALLAEPCLLALKDGRKLLLLLLGFLAVRRREGCLHEGGQDALAAQERCGCGLLLPLQREPHRRAEARVHDGHELRHADLPRVPHLVAEGGADHHQLRTLADALAVGVGRRVHARDVDVPPVALLELQAQRHAHLHDLRGGLVRLASGARADLVGVLLGRAKTG